MQVSLTYPTRYCEDLVAPVKSSLFFVINRSFFFAIELLNLEFCRYFQHIALRQFLALIKIVVRNRYAMIPIVTPEIDIYRTWQYDNTCKRKIAVKQTSNT